MSTIAELRALLGHAKDLPWQPSGANGHVNQCGISPSIGATSPSIGATYGDEIQARAHATLIAAAINALPALLDVAEAAEDVLAWGGTQHEAAKLDALEAAIRRLEGEK